ncbi:hypothetical protein [Streptomyces sp. NPDC017529]|uniref:hypothetical protein n=1 Tax=Streptomyces sp. NPDC017529 TaxID=3365000 RepID=UPI0037B53322
MDDATQKWLLDQLGTATDTADLDTRYTRLGSARAVAISVLTQRHADLVNNQPASINVSAVVGVTYTENIKALERKIAFLEGGGSPAPDEPGADDPSGPGWSVVRLIERPRR